VDWSDWNPEKKQDSDVGHQNEGYRNPKQPLFKSRKLATLVLHALEEAISRWSVEHAKGTMPPPDEMWHVGQTYNEVREKVRTVERTACDDKLRQIDPEICHLEMHVSSTGATLTII
jgi:hypothetical protein